MSFLVWPFRVVLLMLTSSLLALGQIWTNKVRSTLTVIGIIIGIASVTAVISALTGLKTKVLSEFESLGTNKMYVFEYFQRGGMFRTAQMERLRFRPEQFDGLLEACPSVANFSRVGSTSLTSSCGGHSESATSISGIEPAWHEVEGRAVTIGRPFTPVDIQQSRPVCLVNNVLIDRLELNSDPSGQSILVGGRRFKVIGVIEKAGSFFAGGEERPEVLVPLSTLQDMIPRLRLSGIAASRSPEVSLDAQDELRAFFRRKRHLGPEEADNFRIEVIERYLQQFNSLASAITLAATCIVGISLLVGGVGIMNIMLVSVSERTREIGLRKAVGARPAAILFQFLVEAVILCLVGGMLGLTAGQGLTSLMTRIPNAGLENAYIPFWAVLLSLGFSATVGIVFGMFPAIKAARLDPIQALRHE
jgi:putative ABC transport system permease protein